MKNSRTPTPPRHLSKPAKAWWRIILDAFELDESSLLILEGALESFDRMRQAQEILKREGIVIADRFGQKKQHPATLIERDAKAMMIRQLRELHLNLEPLHDAPGRPAGGFDDADE